MGHVWTLLWPLPPTPFNVLLFLAFLTIGNSPIGRRRESNSVLRWARKLPLSLSPPLSSAPYQEQHFSAKSSDNSLSVQLLQRVCVMAKISFKLEHPLERRQAEAARIREKYPDRIPVIVEKAERSDIPDIDKKKYLVPADLTVGQFVYVVRKRIKLSPEKAIFVFVKNILPPTAAMMSAIYEENKDEDGFLYMSYSGENTFGLP
ncbi:hypothetical protein NMG60_11003112 [Bertholletia excelsa]